MEDRTCLGDGCERHDVVARGLCNKCYVRAKRDGTREQFVAPPRECPTCGESFTVGSRTGNVYCSLECQREAVRLRRRARRNESLQDRRCAACGGRVPLDARSDSEYCSVSCQQSAWYRENEDLLRGRATQWRVNNPQARREAHQRRRARKKRVQTGKINLDVVWIS